MKFKSSRVHFRWNICWSICRRRRRWIHSTHSQLMNIRFRLRIVWSTVTHRTLVYCTSTCSATNPRIIWWWVKQWWFDFDVKLIACFSQAVSDFHLLFYLFGLNCFGTKMKTQMTSLLDAVRTQDKMLADQFMKGSTWSTLEHLIGAHSGHE